MRVVGFLAGPTVSFENPSAIEKSVGLLLGDARWTKIVGRERGVKRVALRPRLLKRPSQVQSWLAPEKPPAKINLIGKCGRELRSDFGVKTTRFHQKQNNALIVVLCGLARFLV